MSNGMVPSELFPRPSYKQLEHMYSQLVAEKDDLAKRLDAVQQELEQVRACNMISRSSTDGLFQFHAYAAVIFLGCSRCISKLQARRVNDFRTTDVVFF